MMISRRSLLTAGVGAVAMSAVGPSATAKKRRRVMGPAVFFVPHQDDEVLSMGAYIQQHVAAGRDIKVILLTDGQSSGARDIIKTNKGIDLSESAFSKARDREFLDSLSRLGVPKENVYFENLLDGGLTLSKVKGVMRDYIAKFPDGSYKTMSWMDESKDHHLLGRALEELKRNGEVPNNDARYCRSRRYPNAPTPGGSEQSGDSAIVLNAAQAYNVWAPNLDANGLDMSAGPRYAIGYTSVPSYFAELETIPTSFVHAGSENYTDTKRANANDWLVARGFTAFL